jgi:CheY-like chemotaxis protein
MTQSSRILVVDDNEDFAVSIALILRSMGNDVRVAHDGFEALEIAAAFQPEVAFVDIGMPRLNGYQLARRMREWRWTRDAVLIAVTAWGGERDRQRAREAGFDRHVAKPIEPLELGRLLAELAPTDADPTPSNA